MILLQEYACLQMANFSNSSLSVWLNWGGVLPPVIQPCQSVVRVLDTQDNISFENVSCAQVCNDTLSLFDSRKHNLETCGLWLTSLFNPAPPDSSSIVDLLPQFSKVGLDTSAYQYRIIYANTISTCLVDFSVRSKLGTYSDGTVSSSCTTSLLFPFSTTPSLVSTPGESYKVWTDSSALKACLDDISSPKRLNPDLAGIGVTPQFYERPQ